MRTRSINPSKAFVALLLLTNFFTSGDILGANLTCEQAFASRQVVKNISPAVFAYTRTLGSPTVETARTLYGKEGQKFFERLADLNPEFKIFIYEPGLIQRLKIFEKFILKKNLSHLSAGEAYKAFSLSLGNRIIYRAMSLTPEQNEHVLAKGILSNFERRRTEHARNLKLRDYSDNRTLYDNVTLSMQGKMYNRANWASPFMSFTEIPAVGIGVAATGYKIKSKNIYLYKVEIPEIEVVRLTKDYNKNFGHESGLNRRFTIKKLDGSVVLTSTYFDEGVELFVFDKIPASRIVESSLIPETELLRVE
jgi:hypothetical protein